MSEQICDFIVTIEQDGSSLNAKIHLEDPTDGNQKPFLYYYYLIKDGVVIDRQGWYIENSFSWTLQEPGKYCVQGYVRVGDDREFRKSEEIDCTDLLTAASTHQVTSAKPVGVSIFGSCTSRDLFRLYPSDALELKTYIARQSVVSAVSEPVPLDEKSLVLDSPFQRTAVCRDFNKSAFDLLREDGSEWLIIDLIDERFSPVKMGTSYVTKSSVAVQGGVIPEDMHASTRTWNGTDFIIDGIGLKSYISRFAEKLLEIYEPDHIIIHRAMTVEQYKDTKGELHFYSEHELKVGNIVNQIISFMYNQLKECIPQAKVIDKISHYYGSEMHLWGLATVHYEDGYYADVMKKIVSLVLHK